LGLLQLKMLVAGRKAVHWIQAKLIFALLALLRLLPADRALLSLAWIARRIGPLFGRHRVAMANLRRAMPELEDAGRKAIAGDMWENMARLAGEYVFLDSIISIDIDNPERGRVEVDGVEIFQSFIGNPRPRIFFTAHMGNFELLPIAAAAYGLDVTAMFRPPNNPYVAERVLQARRTSKGQLVPSKAGAAITLARILEAGGNVGMLVDQKFARGLATTFFGVPCVTSPLLAKLARQFECDIHPAHCIRLPGNRYRLTLEPALPIPRNDRGRVDEALMQAVNDKVEQWIRADPGQWMWFHKRWQMNRPRSGSSWPAMSGQP
jgi:Kdo2-lipid IVA lauroyltransferase/acyltransferase